MQTIRKAFEKGSKEFCIMHLNIISSIIDTGLSKKETEVLASFLSLDENIIKDDLINPLSRKMVMKDTGVKPAGLTNHLTSMVKNKVLLKNEITGRYTLNPYLKITEDIIKYEILIKNVDKK